MRQRLIIFIAFFLLVGALPLVAQVSASLPIAAITDGNVWVYGLDGDSLRLTSARPDEEFFDLMWSPDGTRLAFVGSSPFSGTTNLYATDLHTELLTELANNLHPAMPVSFSPDSSDLIYTTLVSDDVVQAFRYQPAAGQAPVPIGTFDITTGCAPAPGAPLPSDYYYEHEVGSSAYPRFVLAMMPFGLLHSANCRAPDVRLMNPRNGEDTQLFESVDGLFVSPDHTRAVVVQGDTISFVNTELGPYTQIVPHAHPDQIGFGLAGSNEIFYSTREMVGQTPLPQGVDALLGNLYFQMPSDYHVSIHRFSLRTGVDDTVYEADAFGLANLSLMADGDTLIFSQIPNPALWVQAVAEEAILPDDLAAAGRYAAPEVYALSLSSGEARLIGRDWNEMAVNTAGISDE